MSNALSINTILPSVDEWGTIEKICEYGVKSGLLPSSIKTKEQAVIIALKARELGIPAMLGFSHINVVQGKPAISSELMLSLIRTNVPGAIINFLQHDEDACVIETIRPQHKPAKFQYSVEDAKNANLLDKDNWKKFRPDMLRARCISRMARAIYPDAIMGCSYTPEELAPDNFIVTEDGEFQEKVVSPSFKITEIQSKQNLEIIHANVQVEPPKVESKTKQSNDGIIGEAAPEEVKAFFKDRKAFKEANGTEINKIGDKYFLTELGYYDQHIRGNK